MSEETKDLAVKKQHELQDEELDEASGGGVTQGASGKLAYWDKRESQFDVWVEDKDLYFDHPKSDEKAS